MAVTILDIARAAGVGEGTVRRALSGKGYVRTEVRERVLKIAHEMSYSPNRLARGLVTGRSDLIGGVIHYSELLSFHRNVEPFEHTIQEAGFALLLYTYGEGAERERQCLEFLIENRVAGAFLLPDARHLEPEPYQRLLDYGIKVVIIERLIDGLDAPQFIGNSYQVSRLAVDYLISLGHREIAYLAIPANSFSGRERARGFQEALSSAGLSARPSLVVETDLSVEAGARTMAQLLQRKPRPTAVLARHDLVALGTLRAIAAAGLAVPGDISVLGTGDIWFSDLLGPPLTTVRAPSDRMARTAAETLIAMLAGKPVTTGPAIFDVELVRRGSCGPAPR